MGRTPTSNNKRGKQPTLASPIKKEKNIPTRGSGNLKKGVHIYVDALSEGFNAEVVYLENSNGTEAYTNEIKKYVRGEYADNENMINKKFDEINVPKYYVRRQKCGQDTAMLSKGYNRYVFILSLIHI